MIKTFWPNLLNLFFPAFIKLLSFLKKVFLFLRNSVKDDRNYLQRLLQQTSNNIWFTLINVIDPLSLKVTESLIKVLSLLLFRNLLQLT